MALKMTDREVDGVSVGAGRPHRARRQEQSSACEIEEHDHRRKEHSPWSWTSIVPSRPTFRDVPW